MVPHCGFDLHFSDNEDHELIRTKMFLTFVREVVLTELVATLLLNLLVNL